MEKLWLISLNIICAINFIHCEVGVKSRQILPSYAGLQNSVDYRYENATMDAQNLHDAVYGLGTAEKVIIDILTNRTNQQRQTIKPVYKEMFNTDLVDDLKSDSSGNFKSVVKALMLEPHYYLARKLKKALTSFITDDDCVTEILCTKHKDDLILIMNAYETQFNKTLKSQIDESLEGDQKTFFKYLLTDKLRKRGELNPTKVNEQLNIIPNTLDFCTIKENGGLEDFLSKESFEQIALVEAMYEKTKNKTIAEQLKKWCTKDDLLLSSYETVVRYAVDPMKYYAEELYKAMIGLGTNDDKLIRIIVGRSEIDLFNIKNKYQDLYNTSLISSVEAETSGDYENILVRLIKNSDHRGVSRSHYS